MKEYYQVHQNKQLLGNQNKNANLVKINSLPYEIIVRLTFFWFSVLCMSTNKIKHGRISPSITIMTMVCLLWSVVVSVFHRISWKCFLHQSLAKTQPNPVGLARSQLISILLDSSYYPFKQSLNPSKSIEQLKNFLHGTVPGLALVACAYIWGWLSDYHR